MLLCSPFLLLVSVGLAHVFARIKYRQLDEPVPPCDRRMLIGLAAGTVALTLLTLVRGWHARSVDLLFTVMAIYVLGYLGYLAIAFVVTHTERRPNSTTMAVAAPYVVAVASAALLALVGSANGDKDTGASVLIFPLVWGGMYFVNTLLFLLALVWAYTTPFRPPPPIPIAKARVSPSKR